MTLRSTFVAALAAAVVVSGCGSKEEAQPTLQLASTVILFDGVAGAASPAAQVVAVANATGGRLARPTATVAYAEGSGWLTAAVSAAEPYALTVTPATAGLGEGTYHATVQVASEGAAASPQVVAVVLTLRPPPVIGLSAATLAFAGWVDGPPPPSQVLTVTNAGGGSLAAPVVSVQYQSTATGWLTVTVGGAADPYALTVSASPAGLVQGSHGATIEIAAPGAANSPQSVQVRLDLDPAPVLGVSPGALFFSTTAGGAAAPAQVLSVFNLRAGALAAPVPSVSYFHGAAWLSATVTGTADPYTVTVAAGGAGLAPGTYSALLRLDAGAGAGGAQDVAINFTVNAPGAERIVSVAFDAHGWAERGFTGPTVEVPDAVTLLQPAAGGGVTEVSAVQILPGSALWTATLPPGPYSILVTSTRGPRYYEVASGANRVDLGADGADLDASRLASLPTPATFDLAGLLPWSVATDWIQIFDQDAQFWWSSQFGGDVALVDGSTAGTYTFGWALANLALATAADTVWVTQLRRVETTAAPYFHVVAAQAIDGVDMVDGAPAAFTARALAPVAATSSVPVDLRAQAFAAAMPEAGTGGNLDVSVGAQAVPLHVPSTTIDLLELFTPGTADHDYGALTYHRFLPARYRETLFTARRTRVARTLPGGKSRTITVTSQRWDPIGAVPAALVPAVGAVPAVRAGGVDVSAAPAAGVGTTPTLTWDAPAVGTADGYGLSVLELFDDPALPSARTRSVGRAVVTSRSFTVPAGWMEAGKAYLVLIEAMKDPVLVGGVSPNRTSPQRGFTGALTQVISP